MHRTLVVSDALGASMPARSSGRAPPSPRSARSATCLEAADTLPLGKSAPPYFWVSHRDKDTEAHQNRPLDVRRLFAMCNTRHPDAPKLERGHRRFKTGYRNNSRVWEFVNPCQAMAGTSCLDAQGWPQLATGWGLFLFTKKPRAVAFQTGQAEAAVASRIDAQEASMEPCHLTVAEQFRI